jgi:DNA-binding transcriptional regulator YiaG
MVKPNHKTKQQEPVMYRPTREESLRSARESIRATAHLTDEDIDRAIANDPDAPEMDGENAVFVRPGELDVAMIRAKLSLSQAGFAAATGIPHRLVSDWEQGRKKPSAAARAFLLLVDAFGKKALKQLARHKAA